MQAEEDSQYPQMSLAEKGNRNKFPCGTVRCLRVQCGNAVRPAWAQILCPSVYCRTARCVRNRCILRRKLVLRGWRYHDGPINVQD